MVILHAFLALFSGLATTVLLVMVFAALVARLAPSWAGAEDGAETAAGARPQGWGPGYVFVNLGDAFLAAAAGGYVTAWTGAASPLVHVLALGMVVLALAALSVLQERGKQPVWFQLTMVAISPLGVLAGGLVRLRVLGIL